MKLPQLIASTNYRVLQGEIDLEVSDISYDSRNVPQNSVFVCLQGTAVDGHTFAADVAAKGAIAIVVGKNVEMLTGITYILVEDTRVALALMSCEFFGNPSQKLDVIGITGTKGKTTVSYMVKKLLENGGHKVGLIGTIQTIIGEQTNKTKNTTPESYELQKLFRQMLDAGCDKAVVEVSSQGLKMHRVDGTRFPLGIFTNIGHDHIGENEHADLAEYIACKSLFFKMCDTALVNTDDPGWKQVLVGHTCNIISYGISGADLDIAGQNITKVVRNERLCVDFNLIFKQEKYKITVGMPGSFSVYNALAAAGTAAFFGVDYSRIENALVDIFVPGRAQMAAEGLGFTLLIDYAHNEISMESLLRTLREYNPSRLICLFGCGGNRDKARRYDMGEKAGNYADLTILAEDNPRFESNEDIFNDILVGMNKAGGKYKIVCDRKEAIFDMLNMAKPGDICVLIGKGHEDYQEIKGVKYPFVESEIVREWVKNHNG